MWTLLEREFNSESHQSQQKTAVSDSAINTEACCTTGHIPVYYMMSQQVFCIWALLENTCFGQRCNWRKRLTLSEKISSSFLTSLLTCLHFLFHGCFWTLSLLLCLSWSSCTRWAFAPERTVWGSFPGTSGTCRWPAATWSDGHGMTDPAPRGIDLRLAQTDECERIFLGRYSAS